MKIQDIYDNVRGLKNGYNCINKISYSIEDSKANITIYLLSSKVNITTIKSIIDSLYNSFEMAKDKQSVLSLSIDCASSNNQLDNVDDTYNEIKLTILITN